MCPTFATDAVPPPLALREPPPPAPAKGGEAAWVYRRSPEPKGPLAVFGYDYLADKYGEEEAQGLALLRHQGPRGGGEEYAYEVLNFLDGRRTVQDVRDRVSAVYGPVPVGAVAEYLRALASIGVNRLSQVAEHSTDELLALHGFGPKALRILDEALAARGLTFADAG